MTKTIEKKSKNKSGNKEINALMDADGKESLRKFRAEMVENNLDGIQCCFRGEIEHLRECAQNIVPELLSKEEISRKKMLGIMKKFEDKIAAINDTEEIDDNEEANGISGDKALIPPEMIVELMREMRKVNPHRPSRIIMKSLFLNIFSEFDSFLGMFLRYVFENKPEVLEKSEKQYSAQEIFAMGSIEKFKHEVIEKEIDTIIRKSYIEQFSTFESKFAIDSLKKFENWGKFVEVSQRRNIIMHCNGRVTNQYYENCKLHKCLEKGLSTDDELVITYEYLLDAINVVHEVGIKLLHVIWRKQFSDQREEADNALNSYIFRLLVDQNNTMAEVFGEFACKLGKYCDAATKGFFEVNYCIAMKRLGKQDEVIKFISQRDWSSVMSEYKLAKCILLDDYSDMSALMMKIGDKSDIFTKESYCDFPIFTFVHENEEFKKSFFEVFGIEFDTYRAVRSFNEEINPEQID